MWQCSILLFWLTTRRKWLHNRVIALVLSRVGGLIITSSPSHHIKSHHITITSHHMKVPGWNHHIMLLRMMTITMMNIHSPLFACQSAAVRRSDLLRHCGPLRPTLTVKAMVFCHPANGALHLDSRCGVTQGKVHFTLHNWKDKKDKDDRGIQRKRGW